MAAGSELRAYGAHLNQATANVREVRAIVADVHDKIETVELAIQAVDAVAQRADEFGNTLDKLQLSLKLLDKAGPLKAVASVAAQVLQRVETVARNVEAKARDLAQRIDESGLEDLVTAAKDKAEDLDLGLAAVEQTMAFDAGVVGGLIATLDTVDALVPQGDPAAPAAAGADALVALPNQAVAAINASYADVKSAALALRAAVPAGGFLPVLEVRASFDKVAEALAFLRGPLDAAARLLRPIEGLLDAVGFLFDATVGPVIAHIQQALGIDRVIETASAKITALLPDAGVFDTVLADFDAAFVELDPLGQLDDHLGISAWLDDVSARLLDPVGSLLVGPVGIGSAVADTLQGGPAAELLDAGAGDDTLQGGAGDDVLLAGSGNDLLDGGSGNDTAAFRGSFLEYGFSLRADGGAIVFDHLRPAHPSVADGSDETRSIETYVFADLSLSRTQLLGNVFIAAPGQTKLDGTAGTDVLGGVATAITIDGLGGNDVIVGSTANDVLRGGAGDDMLLRSAGNDSVDGGPGVDTWRFGTDPATGNPHVDADLARASVLVGGTTTLLQSIENVVVEDNRTAYLFGDASANRLVGFTSRDLLDGRAGSDNLEGGAGDDVLIGGPGADTLSGGEGNDTLVAGDRATAGVQNHYDGGAGDFDMLSYAADLRDLLAREHIDTGMRAKARFQEDPGPVRVLGPSGLVERLSADGQTVIATDVATGIEAYQGSDHDDELFAAAGAAASVDGGAGDDILHGGLAGRFVGGGAGDDLVYAGIGGAAYDGGTGNDVLDLSQVAGVRWLVRLSGATGSTLRAFNAIDAADLAVPGGSLQNESGPSVLASGTVANFELYRSGDEDDYFELRSFGHIAVHGAGGNDFLFGDDGGDGNPSFSLYGEAGDDHLVLQDSGRAEGGSGEDRIDLDATSGDSVTALGGDGDDVLTVRGGLVDIDGGAGFDLLSAAPANVLAGLDADLAAGTVTATGANPRFTGSVRNVEGLIGSDLHADALRGAAAGEQIVGAGGNDLLEGRGGNDALYGGQGSDSLNGGAGDDVLHGGAGNDALLGGDGTDTASWAFSAPGGQMGAQEVGGFGRVIVDLATGIADLVLASGAVERDTLSGIENVLGGAGDDTLRGNAVANVLAGGAGADVMEGREGNDVLMLEGDDTASGGGGDDRFVIGSGLVVIDGGAGHDVLDFGSLRGSVTIDAALGTYAAMFEVKRPVWRDGGGTAVRSTGGQQFTPQSVLESDPTHANSPDDASRTVPAGLQWQIVFETVLVAASGSFTGIEQFVGGAADLRLIATAGTQPLEGSADAFDLIDFSAATQAVAFDLTSAGAASHVDAVRGTPLHDELRADDGGVLLQGLAGNDLLIAGGGNDQLDGGAGLDTAVQPGARAGYSLAASVAGFELTELAAGDTTDTLIDVERLHFADGATALDLDGHAGQAALLLGAVLGAGALAQRELVGTVLALFDAGQDMAALCDLLVSGGIMAQLGAGPDNHSFVQRIAANVLDEAPPAELVAALQALLDVGALTQGGLLTAVAAHPVNQSNVDLVGLAATGLDYA